jgi:hypothetical protein
VQVYPSRNELGTDSIMSGVIINEMTGRDQSGQAAHRHLGEWRSQAGRKLKALGLLWRSS